MFLLCKHMRLTCVFNKLMMMMMMMMMIFTINVNNCCICRRNQLYLQSFQLHIAMFHSKLVLYSAEHMTVDAYE